MRSCILILLLLLAGALRAQDLSGTWEGTEEGNYMKLVLLKVGKGYVGYTYDTDPSGGWCRVNFRGTYDAATRTLKGSGDGMIAKRGGHVECTFELRFARAAGADRLDGSERTKGMERPLFDFLDFDEGPVELRRTSHRADTTAYMRAALPAPPAPVVVAIVPKPAEKPAPVAVAKKPATAPARSTRRATAPTAARPKPVSTPKTIRTDTAITVRTREGVPPAAKPVASGPSAPAPLLALKAARSATVVEEISTSEAVLTIQMFDNGEPDGDTVSILHNDRLLVDHRPVSVQPYSFTVHLDDGSILHEITLIAHNMGRIPPNTASLIVEAGEQRYRLTATTDLQRNAVIRIRYKP